MYIQDGFSTLRFLIYGHARLLFSRINSIHPTNSNVGLKEMGKVISEGREKGLLCWLSEFSKTKLRQPTGQLPSQRNFPIFFKPKVAIAFVVDPFIFVFC